MCKPFPMTNIVWLCLLSRFVWRYTQNFKRQGLWLICKQSGAFHTVVRAFIRHTQYEAKPVQLIYVNKGAFA